MGVGHYSHLDGAASLVTTGDQARAAFVAVLVEKGDMAIPIVEQAKALRVAVASCNSPLELMDRNEIWPGVLAAAGILDRDMRRLSLGDKTLAIMTLIEEYLLPRGEQFVEELVFRFLLTKGASLAKRPRQMLALISQRRFARGVAASLLLRGITMLVKVSTNSSWQAWDAEKQDIPLGVRGIAWSGHDGPRTLLFNYRVPLVGRRFDVVLKRFVATNGNQSDEGEDPEIYLGLGEMEAEMDASDADRHWRGARTAFKTAWARFGRRDTQPQLFYIGAAIMLRTAEEIWEAVQDGQLHTAANSHYDAQLGSVCQWIIQL